VSSVNYPNGAGETSGDPLVTAAPITVSGAIWYVNSATGSDAGGARGKERIRPLATLAQAHSNASAGDIIVLAENHAEVLTSSQVFNKAGIVVASAGSGATRARFTRAADIEMFDITAAGVQLRNLYLAAPTVNSALKHKIRIASSGCQVIGCYIECNDNDGEESLQMVTGAGEITVRDTYFVSTSTDPAAAPNSALGVLNDMSGLHLENLVIDGGESGWDEPYAIIFTGFVTRMDAVDIDLLNDSDAFVTGATGWWTTRNASGSARVVW
jgi:hypothetical protein